MTILTAAKEIWLSSLQFLFGWSISISPYLCIFLVSVIATLISTLIYKYTSDQLRLKDIKDEMDNLKKKMKENSGNAEIMNECNKKITALSFETMKHSIFNWKYMVLTLVPLALVYNWLRLTFTPMNLWGSSFGWFWIYLIFTMVASQILRKVLKVF